MKKRFKLDLAKIKIVLLNFYKKPNRNAIWVFGFQKSGTSAIAALFARKVDKSVTIDCKYLWEPYRSEMFKKGVTRHVNKYSLEFSRDIIKEPGATFFIPKIESYFCLDKYIFIIRNPYDNIRSILNRLQVPGNQDSIDLNDLNFRWRSKFKRNGINYVQDLAELWLEANNQKSYMSSEKCVLVKYEDFVNDKIGFIEGLAKEFNLENVNDISNIVDKPFQPKGNSDTDILKFFGKRNLEVISEICGERMKELGYNQKKY